MPTKRSAWRALLEAHTALVRIFEQDLQRDCNLSIHWYDVLIRLWLAPAHTMRMSELAKSALLSRSWLTRRVEQLEDAGLVRRHSAEDDGRGVLVTLTPKGRRAFARAERSHARSVEDHFSCHLSQEEADVLTECGDRLARAAHGRLDAAPSRRPRLRSTDSEPAPA